MRHLRHFSKYAKFLIVMEIIAVIVLLFSILTKNGSLAVDAVYAIILWPLMVGSFEEGGKAMERHLQKKAKK